MSSNLGEDDARMQRALVLALRDTIVGVASEYPEVFARWPREKFQARMTYLAQRRGHFLELWYVYDSVLRGDVLEKRPFTRFHGADILPALWLQVLEGPIKEALRIIWFLSEARNGGHPAWDWTSHGRRYLSDAVDGVRHQTERGSLFHELADGIAGPEEVGKYLRNSMGHSDYRAVVIDGEVWVRFALRDNEVEFPFDRFMGLFRRALDVEVPLHAGIHLGLSRVDGTEPYLPEDPSSDAASNDA